MYGMVKEMSGDVIQADTVYVETYNREDNTIGARMVIVYELPTCPETREIPKQVFLSNQEGK